MVRQIRNFLGERRVRRVVPVEGVTIVKATDVKVRYRRRPRSAVLFAVRTARRRSD